MAVLSKSMHSLVTSFGSHAIRSIEISVKLRYFGLGYVPRRG